MPSPLRARAAFSRPAAAAHSVCLLRARRGVTLLELLVVMLILLMVTAAAIPIIVPAMQNRQMRESSRLVSSYLTQARTRAIETGHPVGVKFERFDGQPFALTLSQVEVPPTYAGDTYNSKCIVVSNGVTPLGTLSVNNIPLGMTALWFGATMDPYFNPRLVRVGDLIQFGGGGPVYTILGPDEAPDSGGAPTPDGVIDIAPVVTLHLGYLYPATGPAPNILFPWAKGGAGLPPPQPTSYQVTRQPMRSSAAPLQLPEGMVIDLACSGVGNDGVFMNTGASFLNSGGMQLTTGDPSSNIMVGPVVSFDPVVVFSPSGRLEWVSNVADGGRLARPTDPVYFLIGRRELMFDATQKSGTDARDAVAQNLSPISTTAMANDPTTWPTPPAHFWVSIGYQTGQVSVAEVARNFQNYQPAPPKQLPLVVTDALTTVVGPPVNQTLGARILARQSQSVGGR